MKLRKLLMLTVVVAVVGGGCGTTTAQAYLVAKPSGNTLSERLKSQTINLKHARYVCNHGANASKRWSCKAVKWLQREWHETHAALHPFKPTGNVTKPFTPPACTYELLNREGGMNPHKWNGGHVAPWTPHTTYGGSGAYGGPQALPGDKMKSAGADWAHNIWTQIKWMMGYVSRYGGMCAALSFQKSHGYY